MDKIKELRESIDAIDDKIMSLLEERFNISNEIGKLKEKSKINVLDKSREEKILSKTNSFTHKELIKGVYSTLLHESKSIQRR